MPLNRRDVEALSDKLAYSAEQTAERIEFKSLRGAHTLGHKAAARLIRNKRKLEAAKRIPFSGYFPPGAPILPPHRSRTGISLGGFGHA